MIEYKNETHFLRPIIDAIDKGQLVLFVGSGLSKLCGLPLWKELAVSLLNFCAEDANCDFSYKQVNEILKYIDDERELISIAKKLLRNTYDSDDVFNRFFYKKLHTDGRTNKLGKKMQKLLFELSKIVFTTNADDILDKYLNKENIIVDKDKIGNYKSDFEHKVIHIHGSIKKPMDLVFTTADYLVRYSSEIFKETITSLFSANSQYTVLFIGYGFREMQLLDFLVNVESRESRITKTFALNGYYSNQEAIFDVESEYYREYGVTLISYSKDYKNYYGLIDALEYIQNEVKKRSLVRFDFINKLKKYIDEEPNKNSLRQIKNEIQFLSDQDKIYFLETISKSAKSKEWAKKIILDKGLQKVIFSINNLIVPNKTSKDKEKSIGAPFPGLSLLANVNCYEIKTKEFYLNFISNIEDAYLNNHDLYLNQYAYKSFLKLLFSHADFLLENKTVRFLNLFINHSPEKDIWLLFASSNNKVLQFLPETISFFYYDLMVKTLTTIKKVTYEFVEFDKSYLEFYSNHFSRKIIEFLMPVEITTFDQERYSYDPFIVPISQSYDLIDPHVYLKKWLAKSIQFLKDIDAIELYKSFSKAKDTFSILTSIYIANVHFSKIGQLFLDDLQNFNSDRIYFSEIYSSIQNNIQNFDYHQLNLIISFIDNLHYENEYVTSFCKLDLLKLLQNSSFNNNDIFSRVNELNNFIAINNAESEYRKIVPLDRSKSFFISVSWEDDNDFKLKNKILAMNPDNFVSYLKAGNSYETKFSIHEISNFFDELNSKFDFYNKFTLSKLNGVSNDFLDLLESHLTNQNLNLYKKFELIKEIESLKNQKKSKTILLNSLYFAATNEKHLDPKLAKDIFDYVNAIDVDEKVSEEEYIYTFDNSLFFNNEFLKISLLIRMCSKDQFTNFSICLDRHLNANQNYAMAAMSAHIHYLWSLDKNWTLERLKKIFTNEIGGHNLSFYAFSFSQFYQIDFVDEIHAKGILKQILNSDDFKDIARKYAYLLLCNFLYSNETIDIIKVVADTTYYDKSLTLLLDYIIRTKRERFNKEKFDQILEVFLLKGRKNENMFHIGIELLKFLNTDEINAIAENFILFTFSGWNSSFYCEKLSNIIESKRLSSEISDKIIKQFLINLKDCFYSEDKIKRLFTLIKDKETKVIVLNYLGEINPALFTTLKIVN